MTKAWAEQNSYVSPLQIPILRMFFTHKLLNSKTHMYNEVSKDAFIIRSPSAIEASHPWLMRQFELDAIITQPIALMFIAACLASGRLCLFT